MVLRHKDTNCVNIHCRDTLTQFELGRQHKSWKYRFCVLCRRLITSGRGDVEWKCIRCNKIMTTAARIGCYYCEADCRWRNRIDCTMKRYRIKRIASEIVKQGGIGKYKSKPFEVHKSKSYMSALSKKY